MLTTTSASLVFKKTVVIRKYSMRYARLSSDLVYQGDRNVIAIPRRVVEGVKISK